MILPTEAARFWPRWRKILFRFFSIYFILYMSPWTWIDSIPGLGFISEIHNAVDNWIVTAFNQHLLHVKDVLVPLAGSGDTSFGWAQFYTYTILASIGCVAWTLMDRKNSHYER